MFRVGLTGGIGAGKTAVSDRFARLGVPVIDTDQIARALTAPGGSALPAIREAFGSALFDASGLLDRAALRHRVFGDAGARRQLEAILHPLIRAEAEREMRAAAGPYQILVIPLLIETGTWRDQVQRVLVVECPESVRIERVMARNGLTRTEVEAIVATQASDAQRRDAADDIVVNAEEADSLDASVKQLHAQYLELARQPPVCGTGL